MLLCDAADVPDVHDLSLVPHHAHCDGVLTHLGGNVAVHLDAQVLQHQEPCASQQRASTVTRAITSYLVLRLMLPAAHRGHLAHVMLPVSFLKSKQISTDKHCDCASALPKWKVAKARKD